MRRPTLPAVLPVVAVFILTAGLSACDRGSEPAAPPPEPTPAIADAAPVTATYRCDSGATVGAAYPDPESAQVTWRDRIYVLHSAPAASGARYVDEEVQWTIVTRDGVEYGELSRVLPGPGGAADVLERCNRRMEATPSVPAPMPEKTQAAPGGLLPASAPCKGGQLALSSEGGDAGMGHRVAIMGLRNTGTQACSLTGYAAVTVQDRQGRDLTAIRAETVPGSYLRAGQAPAPVNLAPNAKAYFDVAWTVIPHEGQGETVCPSVTRLRATVPGDATPVAFAQALTPCGGRIEISPFRAVAEPTPG
jgi:hypothetical protein